MFKFLTNWIPGPFPGKVRAPRPGPGGMDLDGAEDFPRPRTGYDRYGYPPMIGAVSGFMPLLDQYTLGMAIAKRPYGPGVNTPPTNTTQIIFPQAPKQG